MFNVFFRREFISEPIANTAAVTFYNGAAFKPLVHCKFNENTFKDCACTAVFARACHKFKGGFKQFKTNAFIEAFNIIFFMLAVIAGQ